MFLINTNLCAWADSGHWRSMAFVNPCWQNSGFCDFLPFEILSHMVAVEFRSPTVPHYSFFRKNDISTKSAVSLSEKPWQENYLCFFHHPPERERDVLFRLAFLSVCQRCCQVMLENWSTFVFLTGWYFVLSFLMEWRGFARGVCCFIVKFCFIIVFPHKCSSSSHWITKTFRSMCDQTYLILTLVDSSSFMAVSAFYSSCDASCFQLVKKVRYITPPLI